MRILRRKSSSEVSSTGIALFVIGLVLATFLGGALRTLLNSEQVHQRVLSELSHRFPRHEFQIESTEVLLSRGLWPGLGLKIRNVVFKQDVCGKLSFILEVPEAILPVDWIHLLGGTFRLGQASVQGGHIHLNYKDCIARTTPGQSELLPPMSPTERFRMAKIQPPRLDWQTLGKYLDGIEFKNFTVTYERNVTWKLAVSSAAVKFGDEMHYHALVSVQKSLPFGALMHNLEVDGLGIGRILKWDVHSEFKEGRVRWSGNWDLNTNIVRTGVVLKQMPMKDLIFELHQMGFVARKIDLKATWLTSDLEWQGKLQDYKSFPLNINAFSFIGGYGRVDLLEPVVVNLDNEHAFAQPARVKVQKLQLEPKSEAFQVRVLSPLVSRLGIWSGTLQFFGPKKWEVDGFLENTEIVFSNQSVRGKQMVRRMHTLGKRSGSEISLQVDEMELQDGDFRGLVSLKWDQESKTGTFEGQISSLALSRSIQNLLVGGQIAPLKITGRGQLREWGLEAWSAYGELAEVSGPGWRGEGLSVKSKPVGRAVQLDVELKSLRVDQGWRFARQLAAIDPEFSSDLNWHSGAAKFLIESTGGQLQALSAVQEKTGEQWRARGTWVRDADFSALLSVSGSGRLRSFALRGTPVDLRVDSDVGNNR